MLQTDRLEYLDRDDVDDGVKRSVNDTGSCADTYLNAGQMLAADWNSVCSVSVAITFTNPIPPQNPPTITIRRVIATMNAAGVNS